MTARAHLDRACKKKVEHSAIVEESEDGVSGSASSICGESAGSGRSVGSVIGNLTFECTSAFGVESSVIVVDRMSSVEEQEVRGYESRDSEEIIGTERSESRRIMESSVSDRVERAPSPVSSDLVGGSGDPSANEFMRMFQGMMAGLMKASDSRGSDTLLDKGRMVDSIPNYKDGTEISKFIRGMEADLRDIGVSRAQYKSILLSKLTPKVSEHVVDLVDEEGCTYDSLKRKLLEKVGLSRRDLEIKLFNDLEEDTKSMDRVARYKHVKALVDRVCMMVKDKEELALFMAKGLFRVGLPLTEQGLIDGRKITCFNDLSEVATTLKSTNARTKDQLRAVKRESGNAPKCFRCHGYGHKFYECRVRMDDRSSRIVCFTCNQSGHKSPECPTKVDKNTQNSNSKSSDSTQKNLGIRSGSKPKHNNWLAVGTDFPLVERKVNGLKCMIAPDTGAEITVFPGNLVYESQLLPGTVEVRGATGVPVHLCMAEVEFEIEGESFARKVAVAHAGMLCDKVLFSVPMDGSMARKLLMDAVRASDDMEAKVVGSEDVPEDQTPAELNVGPELGGGRSL